MTTKPKNIKEMYARKLHVTTPTNPNKDQINAKIENIFNKLEGLALELGCTVTAITQLKNSENTC